MSANEFAFLALGLLLGLAVGAAVVEVVRSRPSSPHQVRVTVTADSLPRRVPSTLSGLVAGSADAAANGPADPATLGSSRVAGKGTGVPMLPGARRTSIGVPIRPEPDADLRSMLERGGAGGALAARLGTATAMPGGLSARLGSPVAAMAGGAAGASSAIPALALARAPSAALGDRARSMGSAASTAVVSADADAGTAEAAAPSPVDRVAPLMSDGPCLEARRLVDERCGLAERLRMLADEAETGLREQQRVYDDHVQRAEAAERTLDPRALRAAKEGAQREFRRAREQARDRVDLEAAARTWLAEINRVNGAARTAATELQRERQAVGRLGPQLERLVVEVDAARINAEAAGQACLEAREALAACEEAGLPPDPAAVASPDAPPAPEPAAAPTGSAWPGRRLTPADEPAADALGSADERPPVIVRLLRGDRATLLTLVATLAGDDVAGQRHWQLLLTDLVDAILARAIEAGWLEYPENHPFWGLFASEQDREIGLALASLGYRFDGLGGFADGRVPGQRDLSLAVGYAGQDPMRIRQWPTEAELPDLLRDVTVAADSYLAAEAGGLTLGELVGLLGRRADGLADLWNAWGRVRPLLLDTL